MARILSALLLLVVALVCLLGCGEQKDEISEIKHLKGNMRILFHEYERYTIFVELPGGKVEVHQFGVACGINTPEFTHDVPAGQPMRLTYQLRKRSRSNFVCKELLTVHLHSVVEIGGGGWDHGKRGHGQTNVIE